MQLASLFYTLFSPLLFNDAVLSAAISAAASNLKVVPASSRVTNITLANVSVPGELHWPSTPYDVALPDHRKGSPYILVTSHDNVDHGLAARSLALAVCTQMLGYIQALPAGSLLTKHRFEKSSFGEHYAVDYSVFMNFAPFDNGWKLIDRELAFFAMLQFKDLVGIFGALQGEWEIWIYGVRMARSQMHVWKWPNANLTEQR